MVKVTRRTRSEEEWEETCHMGDTVKISMVGGHGGGLSC